MSSFSLKMIAIITMFIDHVTAVFVPSDSAFYYVGRIIGRIAFPIFVFLLVEGFHHTSDVKKYLKRLGVFALLSEIPFDLAFYNSVFQGADIKTDLPKMFSDPYMFDTVIKRFLANQNVFFTLFIGLGTIYCISLIDKKYNGNLKYTNIFNAIITIVACFIAVFLKTDYNMLGILLIVAYYLFRGNNILLASATVIISGRLVQALSALAIIPISFYNGKRGKNIKYFFYAFYPLHLLILYFISLFI